jgi:hypothetical protein
LRTASSLFRLRRSLNQDNQTTWTVAREDQGQVPVISLAQNYPSATCGPVTAHWLRVYPPGSTVAGYAGYTFSACSSASAPLLTVLPVRLGKGT